MIVIINYGMGNLRSVYNKFKRMDVQCKISSDIKEIEAAEKLILPGVGHFKYGIENLSKLGLIDILNRKVIKDKTPIMGICLGTQLFCKHSEEGESDGLGWIDAEVVRFKVSDKIKYKVPHMGWNDVKVINSNSLDKIITKDDKFYFVHSYHLKCNNPMDIWMTSEYDYEFVSAVHRDNIYGTQFHPEKSHDVGYALLKKFVEL
ncbi:MAG TPA: imidazole glycerol phosphate synthase subunit HisH [Ignavibacteriales bacterium]|nr:imidazole glycerol phosphate synthase subunit HisH [Ignavibacteriales bacterium]